VEILKDLAPHLLELGALVLGGLIAKHVKTGADAARATALAQVAADCAAAVYANNPRLQWLELVKSTVAAITTAAGLPTRNRGAIERAAKAALLRVGVSPSSV